MDLRSRTSPRQLERAKHLSMYGLLNYQPFRLADDFCCGAGMSVVQGFRADPPMVYCPTLDPGMSAYAASVLASPADRDEFLAANERLAGFYDNMVRQILDHLGGIDGLSVLDAGCNAG